MLSILIHNEELNQTIVTTFYAHQYDRAIEYAQTAKSNGYSVHVSHRINGETVEEFWL